MRPPFSAWVEDLPLLTRVSLCFLLAVHAVHVVTGYPELSSWALVPELVYTNSELYRLFTGGWVHANLLHIALNASALATIGSKLEKSYGTSLFGFLLVLLGFLSSLLYTTLVLLPWTVTGNREAVGGAAVVGFSGVLFALAVLSAQTLDASDAKTVLFHPSLQVSKRALPWIMILLIQVLLPNVSFLGHLTGAFAGLLVSKVGVHVTPGRWLLQKADSGCGACAAICGRASARLKTWIGDAYVQVPFADGHSPLVQGSETNLIPASWISCPPMDPNAMANMLPMHGPDAQTSPASVRAVPAEPNWGPGRRVGDVV